MRSGLNISRFEHFDYKGYLQNRGFDIAGQKEDSLENLPQDSVVLDVAGRAKAVLVRAKWDEKILKTKVYVIQDIFLQKNLLDDMRVMETLVAKVVHYVKKNRIGFLTFRFSVDKYKYLQLFEKQGFKVADILCTYLYPSKRGGNPSPSDSIRLATEKDSQAILKLSRNSFQFSRIVTDKNIPKNIADQFYLRLAKSFLSPGKNLKLVALHKGRVCGFAIGAAESEVNRFSSKKLGYLWLIAVSEKVKGQSYGKKLLAEFLNRFSNQVDFVEISTQLHNIPARRLYTSFGLSPATYIITLHYWNKK